MFTTYDEIREEAEMLRGNINRMRITTNEKELAEMRDWAKRRIDRIFSCRQDQIWKGKVNPTE
jgi:hypothetical protein